MTFPACIATHSTVQVFYVRPNGLIARHDYDADVLDGTSMPAPSIVTIDLTEAAFT